MEAAFGQEAYGSYFDAFMRHHLTLKTGEIPNVRAVYEGFKEHARNPNVAAVWRRCAAGRSARLRRLLLRPGRPADRCLYVFRGAVCAIPTNSLNKMFATFSRALRKDRYLESIQAHLLLMPSYSRFRADQEFQQELAVRDLYNYPRRSYWLRRLEKNYARKERVPVDEYTIEHIVPQNENLSAAWQEYLGPDRKRVQQTWLHTLQPDADRLQLGKTATALRRETRYARRFPAKPAPAERRTRRDRVWDEAAIKARAERLAELASRVCAVPALPLEALDAYPAAGRTPRRLHHQRPPPACAWPAHSARLRRAPH